MKRVSSVRFDISILYHLMESTPIFFHRAVFKSMIEKQFPAPYIPTKKQTKSADPSKKRKHSRGWESTSRAKRPRLNDVIIIDSDSEDDDAENPSHDSNFSGKI